MKSTNVFLKIRFAAFFLLPLLLNSCLTAYVPNTINTPLFSNKGEATLNVAGGNSGIDAQAAYAITDKFAIMANTSISRQNDEVSSFSSSTSQTDTYSHTLFEGGFGYFKTPTDWLNFEVFGGFGIADVEVNTYNFNYDYQNETWTNFLLKGRYDRYFLQPSMGYVSDYFDIAFTPRLTMVNFSGKIDNETQKRIGTGVFVEPNITVKVGFKEFKFFSQFGFSYKVNSSGYNFDYQPFMFSMGAQVTIGRKRDRNVLK